MTKLRQYGLSLTDMLTWLLLESIAIYWQRLGDVNPFTPTYKALKAPIVDTAIQYDCPYDRKSS